mmetsp:Transcript_24599/g.28000  ORF Transcript_24599/g.28000 Transcript_24599/m.28000 type:complete len:83 (-) Transcript_24599:715-963(-)
MRRPQGKRGAILEILLETGYISEMVRLRYKLVGLGSKQVLTRGDLQKLRKYMQNEGKTILEVQTVNSSKGGRRGNFKGDYAL